MQKKSLLVALFCGALCLTGCLKNEESASVAQVRIAKANELNSIAELNKAKAQAEVIYANAEATLKNAQAELEKANAALVLAQAETEKVKAQLLAVQVKLAEVKVEEEKVTLQMMQADLESRLAFLEAEKAAAEAAKQAWVNVLNDLLAQAEIGAIKNAQDILEAEQKLEDYILTQAGKKADSAKYYAGLYFAALKDVEKAQVKELEAKAARVLVNQGAIIAREYIYEEIEATNDTIAMNQAFIDALKEKQTMSPEEAQVALIEARKAAGEAYAAYLAAREAERDAEKARDEAYDKTADFTQGWGAPLNQGGFINAVKSVIPNNAFRTRNETVTVGEGETERTVSVPTSGIRVWSEENGLEFIPFWNTEVKDEKTVRYPYTDVVPNHGYKSLKDRRIVPATINYDNIKEALDKAIENKEEEAERDYARAERRMNRQIAFLEDSIAIWKDTLALHQAYVDARKADVEEAEKAYKDALAAASGNDGAVNDAWDAFQLYMLTKYPTVSRSLFINRFVADTSAFNKHARAVLDTAAYEEAMALIDTLELKGDVKTAFEDYAKARGVWERYVDSLNNFDPIPGTSEGYKSDVQKAQAAYNAIVGKGATSYPYGEWNPDFADNFDWEGTNYDKTALPEVDGKDGYYHFTVTVEGAGTFKAGAYQDSTLSATLNVEKAKAALYEAQINEWAGIHPSGALTVEEAQADLTKWEKLEKYHQNKEDEAWLRYTHAFAALEDAVGIFPDDIKDVYNPDFDIFDVVSFPTESRPDKKYEIHQNPDAKKGWVDGDEPAGSAQATLCDAVNAVLEARETVKALKLKYMTDRQHTVAADAALESANAALILALGGDPTKDDIEDYLDEEADKLYADYVAARDEMSIMDVLEAGFNLLLAYGNYPDQIGALDLGFSFSGLHRVSPVDWAIFRGKANFGWLISSYMVDPEATYIDFDGEEKSIAQYLYPAKNRRQRRSSYSYRQSLQWKIDDATNQIEVELPAALEEYGATLEQGVQTFASNVAKIVAAVNAYKSFETGYQNWVAEREAAQVAYNEARIARWAAEDVQEEAENKYKTIDAVANEGIYVYDPYGDLDEFVNDSEAARLSGGNRAYVKISIAKQIELLEEDNERLEAKVKFLRNVLTDGKKVLAVVNEILDQKIAVLSEEVAIKAALALQYKEIMNAYLGITDEEDVEGETGPLDGEGEGDDEE